MTILLIILAIGLLIGLKQSNDQKFEDWQKEHPFTGEHSYADGPTSASDRAGAFIVAVLIVLALFLWLH